MLVTIYQSTWCDILEQLNFRQHNCDNPEPSNYIAFTERKTYAADTLTTAVLKYKYGRWSHKDLTTQPAYLIAKPNVKL
jgi:hypothetical protein